MAADRVIRWTTAGAAAGVAAMASYEHAHALVRALGEAGRRGRPVPLTMDGLIYVTGAAVAAWPTVALVGSYELLMMIIRSAAGPPEQSAQPPRDPRLAADEDIHAERKRCINIRSARLPARPWSDLPAGIVKGAEP
jgi:hypothetical protein